MLQRITDPNALKANVRNWQLKEMVKLKILKNHKPVIDPSLHYVTLDELRERKCFEGSNYCTWENVINYIRHNYTDYISSLKQGNAYYPEKTMLTIKRRYNEYIKNLLLRRLWQARAYEDLFEFCVDWFYYNKHMEFFENKPDKYAIYLSKHRH